jgi:hypothetical protein
MQKSVMMTATVGLVAGYNNNVNPDWTHVNFLLWKMSQEHVPFCYQFSRVVYPSKWGCPAGGEHVVVITAMANPEFEKDIEAWKEKYVQAIEWLSIALKQETSQIFFQEGEFKYLKPSGKA